MEAIGAARTTIKLWYNDKDISAYIQELLQSFEYHDFASGQVDDLQVSLADPDDRWLHSWYPDKGARLRAEIIWSEGSVSRRLECGEFVVDTPGHSGPPDGISLKGTSASVNTNLRRQQKTRKWRHITLKQLAANIADQQGVKIVFHGADTPPIVKVDQKDESDLHFLLRICEQEGYTLKVESNRLVVCSQWELDSQAAAFTIERRGGSVISHNLNEDMVDTYKACKVRYKHPDLGYFTVTYTPENPVENGQILTIRQFMGNEAEALRCAKAKLELANRKRMAGEITLYGDVRLQAGLTVNIKGWGVYDGKYSIDEATHSVSGSYSTTIKIAKVFE